MQENNKNSQYLTCWAFGNGECRVLLELYCTKEHCKFHKTPQQFEADAKKYARKFPH